MQQKLNCLIVLAVMVLFAYVATANCKIQRIQRELLVISSHHTHKNDVYERNVCYLLICKEVPLALHRHPSQCKFFPGAVISSCVACDISPQFVKLYD